MDIQILKTKMTELYYKNIESQAKKSKITLNLPDQINIIDDVQNSECNTESLKSETHKSETHSVTDDYMYKKPWNKLNSIHKIIKIKEFVETMTIDNDMKKHLKSHLSDMIKKKQLTKKNDVEYDYINGKVVAIPSLQCKNSVYSIS